MSKTFDPPIRGDLRVLIRVSLPLMLFLFCEALAGFSERVFLSYFSTDAVHASINASYLSTLFCSPCTAIAFIAQVYVGLYQGSKEEHRIGPCVWQLIWFSLLSFLLIFPLSYWISSLYFKNTVIEKIGREYFESLAWGNLFLPLNAALFSFYLGRGKTLLVTISMLGSYALDVFLSWVLIFGIEKYIPALGTQGAPLARILSQSAVSCILFINFLHRKNRERYHTHLWRLLPSALWHYMRVGMVRALAYLTSKACWVGISYILIKKGDAYLDVITVGGIVITFLQFIPSGLYKAVLTIASNLFGGKRDGEMALLRRSCIFYVALIAALLFFPLIVFPHAFMSLFDSTVQQMFQRVFGQIHLWIWLYIVALTIQLCFCALIVAARDLKIQLGCYLLLWPISFVPVYIGFYLGNWKADKLWLLMIFENVAHLFIFILRLRQTKARLELTL